MVGKTKELDKVIPIRNIYYMLSYAYQVLQEQGIKAADVEEFDNVQKLCAEILIKGVTVQIKRGLLRDYIPETETLSSIRGKIEVSESLKTQSIIRRQLVCTHDEFSTNAYLNRVVKTTLLLLVHSDITPLQKKGIKKLLVFFDDVDSIDTQSIDWNYSYNRNNQSYRMLISVCYLVIKGLLQTQADGTVKMMDYLDTQRMSRLYEKFILAYYRREWPRLSATAAEVKWQLDDDNDYMLPSMKTDITLSCGNRILIIDAKYYGKTLQSQYDTNSVISGNLYQIFTYVKNKEAQLADREHNVAGMLLYAKTDEEIVPDNDYKMSGNTISVKTLNLNADFSEISNQLDTIASDFFEMEKMEGNYYHD